MAFCVLKVHMICEHMKENINQSVYVKRQGQIIQSSNNVDFLPTNASPQGRTRAFKGGTVFFCAPPLQHCAPPVHPGPPPSQSFHSCVQINSAILFFSLGQYLGFIIFVRETHFLGGHCPPPNPRKVETFSVFSHIDIFINIAIIRKLNIRTHITSNAE